MCYENKVSLKNPELFDGKSFQVRIAFSSDGNYNDEDDRGAFPVAIAILDAFGVVDKLVHVDYCNILPSNNQRFHREMSVYPNARQIWTASANTDSYLNMVIANVIINTRDEIMVEIKADTGESSKLDYAQLNYKGSSPITYKSIKTRFSVTGLYDNTNALPDQIIVVGENPGYLKCNGGGPTFVCEPDSLETFLLLRGHVRVTVTLAYCFARSG